MSPVTPTPDGLSVLIEARDLIRQGWTRGKEHRRRGGKDCYCALGAIWKAGGFGSQSTYDAETRLSRALIATEGTRAISTWNDQQKSKHPVLALFDRAIAAAEGAS